MRDIFKIIILKIKSFIRMIKVLITKSSNGHKESLIGMKSLLYEARQMCLIANDLLIFLNRNHPEIIKNDSKKYSLLILKAAIQRMDSCIVLLENGSSMFMTKNNIARIDPFSIACLVRSIYESMVVHYYYLYAHPNDCFTNILISLWKMSGIKNRLVIEPKEETLKIRYEHDKEEYDKLKEQIKLSEIYKSSTDQKLLKKAMNELVLLVFQKNGDLYDVKQTHYGTASKEIFAGTYLEPLSQSVYKFLSAISHPSYLNCIQTGEYSGLYNKYTETVFEGGIIFLKKLLDNILQVIPEGRDYITNLPQNKKICFSKWGAI